MKIRWLAGASVLMSLVLISCGPEQRADTSARRRAAAQRAADSRVVVGSIDGQVVPQLGPDSVFARPLQYTVQLNPATDGQTNLNPNNTIEVFSTSNLATGGTPCGATPAISAPVSIVNYLPEALLNVQVGMVYVIPTANKLCTPVPSNADPQLSPTFGIIDYSSGGTVGLGLYSTHRTVTGGSISNNGGAVTQTWAFTLPNNSPFLWRARVVADLRPYPAKIESPFVDEATAATPLPQILFISDDTVTANSFAPPSIVSAVHFSTFLDAGMTQTAGDSAATAVLSTTDPTWWGTGNGNTAAAPAGSHGRTVYVQMQNEWLDSASTSVLGQVIPPTVGLAKSFVVTSPATVPALGVNPPGGPVAFTPAPQATGVEIQIQAMGAGRNPNCTNTAPGATIFGPAAISAVSPFSVTGVAGLVGGTRYCYRIRNNFTAPTLVLPYSGSWSGYSDFVR